MLSSNVLKTFLRLLETFSVPHFFCHYTKINVKNFFSKYKQIDGNCRFTKGIHQSSIKKFFTQRLFFYSSFIHSRIFLYSGYIRAQGNKEIREFAKNYEMRKLQDTRFTTRFKGYYAKISVFCSNTRKQDAKHLRFNLSQRYY